MNLKLKLPLELEIKLREQAKTEGKPLEELAIEALQEKLVAEPESTSALSAEAWLKEFFLFTADSPKGNVNADLSRDSIYEGRGQ
jgi:hypothetical protein